MSRIGLAFRCFFRVLFSGRLPEDAATLVATEAKALPAAAPEKARPAEAAPVKAPAAEKADAKPARAPGPSEATRDGALTMLGLLHREGRLIDFLRETLESYS